jgi:hypothetical protein
MVERSSHSVAYGTIASSLYSVQAGSTRLHDRLTANWIAFDFDCFEISTFNSQIFTSLDQLKPALSSSFQRNKLAVCPT